MSATVLSSSPGKKTLYHKDESAGTFTIQTIQDVDPIFENNKRLQTLNDGYSPSRELKRIASIPTSILRRWCKEAGISFRAFLRKPDVYMDWLRKKISDPDNSFVLTAPLVRPGYKGILGLMDAIREGRKIKPKTKWKLIREAMADRILSLRIWFKAIDEWLYQFQFTVRG